MTHHDMTADALYAALRTSGRMIEERKLAMDRHANQIRAAAKAAGKDIDTRADYARGSSDAYAIAGSILAGAFGFASIREIAGDVRENIALPPMLPDTDATQFAPGDTIAAASVVRERMASSDTGE